MPDIPAEAVEAALGSQWIDLYTVPTYNDVHDALAAAAPHLRAQVLAEVQEALRDTERVKDWLRRGDMDRRAIGFPAAADYLRDTLAGDPATTRSEG